MGYTKRSHGHFSASHDHGITWTSSRNPGYHSRTKAADLQKANTWSPSGVLKFCWRLNEESGWGTFFGAVRQAGTLYRKSVGKNVEKKDWFRKNEIVLDISILDSLKR